jgi:hypothetical protein
MDNWSGWPLERLVYLFLFVAYLGVWGQVTLLHWRGGMRSIFMWGPVVYTPLLFLAALIMVFWRGFGPVFFWLYVVGALEGLFGTYKHIGGVLHQVGGSTLRNMMMGPPPLLPVLYFGLGAFGALVWYWPQLTGMGS